MKLSKNLGRVATTFLATAMLASLTAVPAMAASPANVTITKHVLKDENTYAPATTFNFQVQPWTEDVADGELIQPGPEGGVYFSMQDGAKVYTGSIASAPTSSDVDGNNDTVAVVGTATLLVDEEVMLAEEPGIYRYEVKEVPPAEGQEYDGLEYSNEVKYFDVYVTINQETGMKTVSSYMFIDEDDEVDGKDDGIFENDYNDETTGANKTLTVEKELSGLQASPAQEFTFTITISGADKEQYKIVKTKADDTTEAIMSGETEVTYLTSDNSATFTLQGGEHITVYGLSPEDTYTVSEADYTELGYTTSVEVDGSAVQSAPSQSKISGNEDTVTFINSREATAPTGLAMDIAPYALLVVVAAAGCFVFLRKRNED